MALRTALKSILVYFIFALQKDLDTGPYFHTKVPLARPGVLVCHPESRSQHSLCPEPSLPTAGARWTLLGVVNCGNLPWIQHSWAGEHSSAWASQLLKGDSSIIGALITPSLSLAPFCSADSTARLEVFAVPQWHQAPATW